MIKGKALLVTILIWLVSLATVLWGAPRLLAVASLGSEGKEAIAKVLSYSTEFCNSRSTRDCYRHVLAAEGHTFYPLILREPHAPGSAIQITYLPADPTIFVHAAKSEPPWNYIWMRLRQGDDIVWPAFGLLFLLVTSTHLVRAAVNRDRLDVGELLARDARVAELAAKNPHVGELLAKSPRVEELVAKDSRVAALLAKDPRVAEVLAKDPRVAGLLAAKDARGSVSASVARRIVIAVFVLSVLTIVVAIAIRLTTSS